MRQSWRAVEADERTGCGRAPERVCGVDEIRTGPMPSLHASCVVLGENGILIRGPSGSGKSRLARAILTEAARHGRFARLVADDRVRVEAQHGRLLARAVEATAGFLEMRGTGIARVDYERAALVRLLVDCSPEGGDRLPEKAAAEAELCGVTIPRIFLPEGESPVVVLWRLGVFGDTVVTD